MIFFSHSSRIRILQLTFALYALIRDGPLQKLWRGGEFSSRRNFFRQQIPCMNFFNTLYKPSSKS